MQSKVKLFYLGMITVIFASNYLVQFPINDWLTWGAFTYPISFFVTELANRFYGPRQARKIVYVGFFFGIVVSALLATPRIAFASCSAFIIAQLLDISVFNRLRNQVWWMAPFFASVLASIVDASIFWTVAFAGEDVPLLTWALGDTLVKIGLDFLMLTPFRFAIRAKPIKI